LSIVDASICSPSINWDDFSEEEGECLQLNDLDFDKLSKKDMIKIKRLFERIKKKSCNSNNKKSISLAKLKSSRL
jgi:hypothetical protein